MKKISKPSFSAKEVFEKCVGNTKNPALRIELIASSQIIQNAEDEFEENKIINELFKIPRNGIISNTVNKKVLVKVYSSKLVKKNNLGRIYYDKLLFSAPRGICPLCNQRIANTLDHYLPKSEYPLLSVAPLNLIPSCTDCNKGKLSSFPLTNDEETLHPYYDDVENENWLKCEVINVKPIIFRFFTSPPNNWDNLLKLRIEYHFNAYNLNELYKIHAAEEFSNIKFQLEKVFLKGGEIQLKEHLEDCYASRNNKDINSWQSAFYKGLLSNVDFCSGHFL